MGDSRVGGIQLEGESGWRIKVHPYRGIKLEHLLQNADQLINRKRTRILIIVGLQNDLTYLPAYMPNGSGGLMTVAQRPEYSRLMNLITCYDYKWRTSGGLTVIWTIPYTVDFLLYNEIRARRAELEPLSDAHRLEARWCAGKLKGYCEYMSQELRALNIATVELDCYDADVREQSGGDGLHMGQQSKEEVFYEVCVEATKRHPTPEPLAVETYLTAEERNVQALKRDRSKMRRAVVVQGRIRKPAQAPSRLRGGRRQEAEAAPRRGRDEGAMEAPRTHQQRPRHRRDEGAIDAPRTHQQRGRITQRKEKKKREQLATRDYAREMRRNRRR